jgi:hypothetical protein
LQVLGWSAVLFVYCMALHGELVRLKPAPERLTSFYLSVAAGGAAGGIFTGLVAPVAFLGFWELHLGLAAGPVLLVAAMLIDPGSALNDGSARRVWAARLGCYALLLALAAGLAFHAVFSIVGYVHVSRGFFGQLRVSREAVDTPDAVVRLRHGRILHGAQRLDPERRLEPTGYYEERTGIGVALRRHPRRLAGEPLRIGVVGLGTGTLAAYAREGDSVRFYEIDPDVLRLSRGPEPFFTFLKDCPGEVEVVLGDARLSLEREPPQAFDVLVLDAFSGDAIPVHLLTREAFELWLRHLREPDGVLAVHVSNRYLELRPVVRAQARQLDLMPGGVKAYSSGLGWSSDWMLLARAGGLFEDEQARVAAHLYTDEQEELPLWTDSWSNLLGLLRW